MADKDRIDALVQGQAVQGEKIENIERSCQEIKSCLIGNGQPGLVVRTDRLEQKDKFKSKLFWLSLTVVSGLLIKEVVSEIF